MTASVLLCSLLSLGAAPGLSVTDLQCEYLKNPLGIGITTPRLSWVLKNTVQDARGEMQTAWQILVASSPEGLGDDEGDLWDSGKVEDARQLGIAYSGKPLASRSRCYWKVRVWDTAGQPSNWSEPAFWTVGLLSPDDCQAQWIAHPVTDSPEDSDPIPATHLRGDFPVAPGLARATAYICGLGLYELRLNGQKVGEDVLVPAYTRYESRTFYLTYDVTEMMQQGENAVGVMLGGGRFAFGPGVGGGKEIGNNMLLCQLEMEYADGSREVVATGPDWHTTQDGPIRAQSEYNGEVYDARMELTGWDTAAYDDSAWSLAEVVPGPPGRIEAQMTPPMRVTEIIKPKSMTTREPGIYVFDMGQNMTGWCRLKVKGTKGTQVTMRFAETLLEDGSLDWRNMLKARPQDTYTLKGEDVEEYTPRFTYHGFRYVEVLGLPYTPGLDLLEGQVVHDDVARAGAFTSSNKLLNRIHEAASWGIRGNFKSIPTDCPQRAERHGWTGDRLEVHRSEQFFWRANTFYRKWLQDMTDSQAPDGVIGSIAPGGWPGESVSITWPGVFVTAPETLWLYYGDEQILTRQYPPMKRWIDRMIAYLENDRMPLDKYGDWCPPPASPDEAGSIHTQLPNRRTIGPLIGTAYFRHLLDLMAGYARHLSKDEDAARYTALSETMVTGLNRVDLNLETGVYGKGSQTSYVLPLAFGMAPPELEEKVFENLVNLIEGEYQGHVGTGVIGGAWLYRVLSEHGRCDLAYRIATQPDYPGFGFMINNGGTTIWELYNAPTADKLMNSRNHVMQIGDFGIWLYEYLAGIRPDPVAPGFKHILLKPYPVKGLDWVDASYHSVQGPILSRWKQSDERFTWKITLPPNTTATVYLPAAQNATVLEGGKPVAQASGIAFVGRENDRLLLELASGSYALTVQ